MSVFKVVFQNEEFDGPSTTWIKAIDEYEVEPIMYLIYGNVKIISVDLSEGIEIC